MPTLTGKSKRGRPKGSRNQSRAMTNRYTDYAGHPQNLQQVPSFVKRLISNSGERKQAFTTMAPTDFNSGISGSGDALRIIPNVTQGTDGHNRIGDQVRLKSINLRAILQMMPQGYGQGDGVRKIAVRVMCVTPKSFQTWASASANTATWMPMLLKKGGTTTAFTGAIDDIFAPINSDAITTHFNKVYYLKQDNYIQASASGITGLGGDLVRFINLNIKCKNKIFKYDPSVDSGLTPSNGPAYVLLVGYAFVDGTSPDTLSVRVRFQYDTIMNFTDA